MSCLDVAGVVLGAISLIVLAIEKYRTTRKRIRFFRYRDGYITDLTRTEWAEVIGFNLKYVISKETKLKSEEVNTLFSQPNSTLFRDDEIAQAIQENLGESYLPYHRAITKCEEILARIAADIIGLSAQSLAHCLYRVTYFSRNRNWSIWLTGSHGTDCSTSRERCVIWVHQEVKFEF